MSYTALYRKFRPSTFEDVKGQDHIVTTLKNQIKANRIGHAYLFCGTRGTGKTTIAKIYAKAANCENPIEGSPCGLCTCCKSITEGKSLNVVEIDAASNRGIEDIRRIRDEVNYSPTEGRFKVYIIDEVHMLTTEAFNALLKTLEEPPEYVIFILATTESHKIPITIKSRCQKYDFKRISIDTITDRMAELMAIEDVDVEPRALKYIAKAADGSMRDALSLLDQCIAFYLGQSLTYDSVLDVLGAADNEIFSRLLTAINEGDTKETVRTIDDVLIKGNEPGQFIVDFTWYIRNIMLLKSDENMEEVLDISSENLSILKEEAKKYNQEQLMHYIDVLSDLSNKLRFSTQKRILMEIAMIRLTRPQMDTDYSSLIVRIEEIEKKLEGGFTVAPREGVAPSEPVKATAVVRKELPPAIYEEVVKAAKSWKEIKAMLHPAVATPLLGSVPTATDERTLTIAVAKESYRKQLMSNEQHLAEIKSAIGKLVGKNVEIRIVSSEGGNPEEEYTSLDKAIENNEIDFEIITED